MSDQLNRQAATIHGTSRVANSGLSIAEIEDRCLWSIQANRKYDLPAFAETIFGATPEFGKMLCTDALRLVQLWPHKAYLISAQASLPTSLDEFSSMLTDIGHGFCELSLVGEQVIEFLDNYSSTDLKEAGIVATRNLRCRLGQYPIILWWDQPDDIRILIDRSYAQSFCDYLEQLMQRWCD